MKELGLQHPQLQTHSSDADAQRWGADEAYSADFRTQDAGRIVGIP